MGDQADYRLILAAGGGRQCRQHIAGVCHRHIGKPQLGQLARQLLRQHQLPGAGGVGLAVGVGGRIIGYIVKQSFVSSHLVFLAVLSGARL